ncbi:LOW QUALITY PROTEIN: hypothetical protein HZS_129 [Henneguya salminicola]|nr:LOW QUALITY PROTEIN: hypothetical protein HZS_129 [Henneguya salminicola]
MLTLPRGSDPAVISVKFRAGVPQGDPLSPLLFNLAVTPLSIFINRDYRRRGPSFSPRTMYSTWTT